MNEQKPMTLNQYAEINNWPTLSALRSYRARQVEYGCAHCFIKSGNRVLIKPVEFQEWILSRGENGKFNKESNKD